MFVVFVAVAPKVNAFTLEVLVFVTVVPFHCFIVVLISVVVVLWFCFLLWFSVVVSLLCDSVVVYFLFLLQRDCSFLCDARYVAVRFC